MSTIWLKLLNNWKLASMGVIALLFISMAGATWYYKSKSALEHDRAIAAEADRDKFATELQERTRQSQNALKAIVEGSEKASSRETLINSKKIKVSNEAHANDNLDPSYDVFMSELWVSEQAANDNRTP